MSLPTLSTVLDPVMVFLAQAPKAKDSSAFIAILVAIVMGLAIIGLSFMSSRRGHRD
jgi:hypothetical protein